MAISAPSMRGDSLQALAWDRPLSWGKLQRLVFFLVMDGLVVLRCSASSAGQLCRKRLTCMNLLTVCEIALFILPKSRPLPFEAFAHVSSPELFTSALFWHTSPTMAAGSTSPAQATISGLSPQVCTS